MPKIGESAHTRTLEPAVITDLDTLLTALYVELTDHISPSLGLARSGAPPPSPTGTYPVKTPKRSSPVPACN